MADRKIVICPFCGAAQTMGSRCGACGVAFDPETRLDLQFRMGPWFLRDPQQPFRAGWSYEEMVEQVEEGEITRYSIVRGPTTGQLWTVARKTPGIAHLLGDCCACNAKIPPGSTRCPECDVSFIVWDDRNSLGLPEPGHHGEVMTIQEISEGVPTDGKPLSTFLREEVGPAQATNPSSGAAAPAEPELDDILDNAMRQELLAARKRASNFMVVAMVAIGAAIATLCIAISMRPSTDGGGDGQPVGATSNPDEQVDQVDQGDQGDLPRLPAGRDASMPGTPGTGEAERGAGAVDPAEIEAAESRLAGLVGRAADAQLDVAERRAAIVEARTRLAFLQEHATGEAMRTRLAEHAQALDRAERRLEF